MGLSQFLFPFGQPVGRIPRQRRLHLRQQVVVKERFDFRRFQVHDPVQPEIEVPSVKLEHLAQNGLQPVEFFYGLGSPVAHDVAFHFSRTFNFVQRRLPG